MSRLYNFLAHPSNQATQEGIYSHTSLGSPFGSYNISSCAYDDFLRIYCESLYTTNARHLHLTERPTRCFPVLVDLDFRFAVCDGEHRRFDDEFVNRFVTLYTEEIYRMLDADADKDGKQTVLAYILTRPAPYIDKGVLKDGIHIIFSNTNMSNTIQKMLRDRVVTRLQPLLSTYLPDLTNLAEDVLDAGASSNNWQMYGSRKPGREPYLVSRRIVAKKVEDRIDSVEDEVVSIDEASDWKRFVKEFSVRRENVHARITDDVKTLVRNVEQKSFLERKANLLSSFPHELSMTQREVTHDDVTDDETLRSAEAYVTMLDQKRAESYDSWIRVGWALRNIDHRLLKAWSTFSRLSAKFQEGECEKFWHNMKHAAVGLTLGSLKRWAQMDSPAMFAEFTSDSRLEIIAESLTGTHHDLAKLVHSMYKDEFVCAELGAKTFFQFKDHKWVKLEQAHTLRSRISTSVFLEIKNSMAKTVTDPSVDEDSAENEKDTKKKDVVRRVTESLKDANIKDKVMKECAELFYHRNFEQELDVKTHLIGFNNGIYDLEREQFRDGRPEDLVSMCTGIDYLFETNDDELTDEIDDFFCKVFPDSIMRDYAIGRFASFISGDVTREEFYIFTGSGSNGKSKTIELFEASFGGYCCKLPTSLLTQKRAAAGTPSSELARTCGRRFCVLQEPGESERLNVGVLKELSGGDEIVVRALYKEPFQFRPQFNMVMTCNTLPAVPDTDGGTWRRIKVLEFGSKFVQEPKAKNEFAMDADLNAKFKRWKRPFMMNLIKRYCADKGKKLVEPKQVSAITQRYKAEQDIMAAFVAENFQYAEGCETSVREVQQRYREWYKTPGQSGRPDQMLTMVSKLKLTAMKEPVGAEGVPLLRHIYENWVALDD